MADLGSLLLVLESIADDFENSEIGEDVKDIVMLSAMSCFMRRNVTHIMSYFEQTIPQYLGA